MGSGGRSVDDTHHVVNVDGNLMVLKTYAPLASASSADELLLIDETANECGGTGKAPARRLLDRRSADRDRRADHLNRSAQ